MKTVQMTLEPELVTQVDRVARRLGLTRSAFTRQALGAAIEHLRVQELERRHRDGYAASQFDAANLTSGRLNTCGPTEPD